ncbi:MAG TPA: YsnF/AvaK domain-containing protein [Stellaceae bacterium]|jgi:uncharacterized protein (TIGR02271 family)
MTTLVAIYEDLRSIQNMISDLEALGVSRNDIDVVGNNAGDRYGDRVGQGGAFSGRSSFGGIGDVIGHGSLTDYSGDEPRLVRALVSRGIPEDDAHLYAESVRRGDSLAVVTVSEGQAERVQELMAEHGAIDVDERGATLRSSGFSTFDHTREPAPLAGTQAAHGRTGDEIIPIVEEELRVGKRTVERGRVHIRSYVVEVPVEQQVRLRHEHVEVERRPASGTAPVGADAFREREIEVREVDEEAVVEKVARVREEVVVRKDVGEHAETVRDTVRRTEVEVDRGDAGVERSGTTATGVDRMAAGNKPSASAGGDDRGLGERIADKARDLKEDVKDTVAPGRKA